jgi:hypothetical protein
MQLYQLSTRLRVAGRIEPDRPEAVARWRVHAHGAKEGFHDDETSDDLLKSHAEGREARSQTDGDATEWSRCRSKAAQLGCQEAAL